MKSLAMKTAALSAMIIALMWGCAQEQGADAKTGGMLVVIDQSLARSSEDTFSPQRSLKLDSFILVGLGPLGEEFMTEPFSEDEVLIQQLTIGTWHMTLLGYSQEELLASADADVDIFIGTVTPWDAVLLPLEGTGTITVSLNWPEELFSDPSVEAFLHTHPESGPLMLSADVTAGTAQLSGEDIDSGYYILTILLKEHGNTVWGDTFTVRIITGLDTSGEVDIMEDQLSTEGRCDLQIDTRFYEPLDVSIAGLPVEELPKTLTLTASGVQDPEVTLEYYWYLDGEPLLAISSSTLMLSDALDPGHYQLTGIVLARSIGGHIVQAGHSGARLEIPE